MLVVRLYVLIYRFLVAKHFENILSVSAGTDLVKFHFEIREVCSR